MVYIIIITDPEVKLFEIHQWNILLLQKLNTCKTMGVLSYNNLKIY